MEFRIQRESDGIRDIDVSPAQFFALTERLGEGFLSMVDIKLPQIPQCGDVQITARVTGVLSSVEARASGGFEGVVVVVLEDSNGNDCGIVLRENARKEDAALRKVAALGRKMLGRECFLVRTGSGAYKLVEVVEPPEAEGEEGEEAQTESKGKKGKK